MSNVIAWLITVAACMFSVSTYYESQQRLLDCHVAGIFSIDGGEE